MVASATTEKLQHFRMLEIKQRTKMHVIATSFCLGRTIDSSTETVDMQSTVEHYYFLFQSFCWTEVNFVGQLVPSVSDFGWLSLADPGGHRRRAPPQQDQFLSFSHTFLPKSVCVGGWCPPTGQHPPNGKSWIHHWLCCSRV